MKRASGTLTTGQGSRPTGIVSGFVLKLARQSTGHTQERFAEALAVDVTTVQGWESGRRPLAAISTGDFLRLTTRLSLLGAPPSTRRQLTDALDADQVLSTGTTAGTKVEVETHPLAARVHRRTLTNLITWPITGVLPQHLQEFTPKVPRRGPALSAPALSADERIRFFDHLLAVAEQGSRFDAPLLRRQAVYLLGFDDREKVVNWLHDEWRRASRRPVRDGDITGLLEARSASVALASAGHGARIHDFVDQLADTRAEVANLNYWAHWIGELTDEQTNDGFMLSEDTRSWTGMRLLRHLSDRLAPSAAHLPLNLHTLYVLVLSRPTLLQERAAVRRRLGEVLERIGSSDCLSRTGRDQVSGLHYALRVAAR